MTATVSVAPTQRAAALCERLDNVSPKKRHHDDDRHQRRDHADADAARTPVIAMPAAPLAAVSPAGWRRRGRRLAALREIRKIIRLVASTVVLVVVPDVVGYAVVEDVVGEVVQVFLVRAVGIARVGLQLRVASSVGATYAVATRVVVPARVIVRQVVGRFSGKILGLGHAVPTHPGACTLSVD
jgi:hypothetical protein